VLSDISDCEPASTMNKSRVLQDGICSRAKEPGPPKIHVRKDFRMKGPAAPFLYRRIAPLAPF